MNTVIEKPKSISETQDDIVEEFDLFFDDSEKYEYIIDLGKKLPPLPDEFKTGDYIVRGCQAQVWLRADWDNGVIRFRAESDAILVRGLVSLLLRIYSGRTPEEIIDAKPEFIDRIGLSRFLTSGRSNGLHSMIRQIKFYAAAYQAKHAQ